MKENPSNYDAWFDYLRLVESEGNVDIIRETYERAVANVPPTKVRNYYPFIQNNILNRYVIINILSFRKNNFGEDIFIFG